MSQENVEVVRRCYRVWDQRDWSQVPELADPDVTIDLSRNVFNPDVYHGFAGFYRLVSVIDEIWDPVEQVPTEFIDAGDNVVTAVTLRGKGRESGHRGADATFRHLDASRFEGRADRRRV